MVPALVIIACLVRALQDSPGFVALCHGYTLYSARTGPRCQHAQGARVCAMITARLSMRACAPAAAVLLRRRAAGAVAVGRRARPTAATGVRDGRGAAGGGGGAREERRPQAQESGPGPRDEAAPRGGT